MVFATGELKNRIERNILRLSDKDYCAPEIYEKNPDWPGDWLGRAVLALCTQYEATKKSSVLNQAKDIIDGLDEYINEDGYFGEKLNGYEVNEQSLSGNSWFVRGLCAYYNITGDEKVKSLLKKLTEKFFLKLKPFYLVYSAGGNLNENTSNGGVSGHITDSDSQGWKHSSDIGCAFILLDGLTDLCTLFYDERLIDLAKTMVEKFTSIDHKKVKFQTHAYLAATRGILRLFTLTKNEKYLKYAVDNFETYKNCGSTVNYGNFNWFERRNSWTEPCAFVDSLILAVELYKITENEKYLQFANRAYLNAFRSAQRKNGGAGCETCISAENDKLEVFMYEALFCCSMRFADGLNYVRKNSIVKKGETFYAYFMTGGRYEAKNCAFTYLFDAKNSQIKINVEHGVLQKLVVYLPDNVQVTCGEKNASNTFNRLEKGEHVYPLDIKYTCENVSGKNVRFWADYLLTEKEYEDNSEISFVFENRKFSPLGDCMSVEEKFGIAAYVQRI